MVSLRFKSRIHPKLTDNLAPRSTSDELFMILLIAFYAKFTDAPNCQNQENFANTFLPQCWSEQYIFNHEHHLNFYGARKLHGLPAVSKISTSTGSLELTSNSFW